MTDEQPVPIYLSPEEELTSVRERLERTQARRIILVIPPQTQLRSHVGWRLIHARMRELGKDLVVISPDRQVRAVARAAGFRVAESQESSPSNRPRVGGSRPSNVSTRGSGRSRIGNTRGGPESRGPQSQNAGRRQTPGASNRPLTPLPPPEPEIYDDEDTLERLGRTMREEENQPLAPPPTLFKEQEAPRRGLRDFHISTTPSVRPSVPGRDDEDDSSYYDDDYNTAKRIRESAGGGRVEQHAQDEFPAERGSRGAVSKRWGSDPFAYMAEDQHDLPLPEQRGSMPGPFEEIGTNAPDIADRSTEIMQSEIEDLGDMGAITPAKVTSLPKKGPASRDLGQRQRRPSGQMRQHSPRSPRPGSQGLDDDDELLDIQNRPTQAGRPSRGLTGAPRPSQTLKPGASTQAGQHPSQTLKPAPRPSSQALRQGAPAQPGQRPSQTLRPGAPAQAGQYPSQTLKPAPRPSSQSLRQGSAAQTSQRGSRTPVSGSRTPIFAPMPPAQAPRRASSQRVGGRGGRGLSIAFGAIVLLLLITGVLFYFVPTATVTISLQAQNFSQNIQLTASANPPVGVQNTLRAQALTHDFSVTGQGTATGRTSVGDKQANGKVTFTNNSNFNVIVPTGTIITTQSGIPFTTDAEAFVPRGGSYPAVPVTAQQAGEAGNVGISSITIIPSASLSAIAQANHTTAQALNLTVTNPAPTTGGGARTVRAVAQADITALKNTLHKALQQQIMAWLVAQTRSGDLHGTPSPNVLASANPLPSEQLSGTPGVKTAEENGTFSGTLTLHISVLFARAAAIQAAAGNLLNNAALKLRQPSMLAPRLPITLANEKGTSSPDGASLAISAKATGAIIKQLPSDQDLSAGVKGKSVGQAISDLKSSLAQSGVVDVQVNVSPSFLNLMPESADRIQVIIQPIAQTPAQNVPNG
ncbi:MAG TPA: baseplate J/gp47 family protein [Ktedonobacteraceae bacterium]